MGYTTDFEGKFSLDKELTDDQFAYLNQFSGTRRMKRSSVEAQKLSDPIREAVGLDVGTEGEFFVGAEGFAGQTEDKSVLDYNNPARTQPGLWCQWVATDKKTIAWDENEKFYNYVEWLQYIAKNFLTPWGIKMNGSVNWRGEDMGDTGTIIVKDNVVTCVE